MTRRRLRRPDVGGPGPALRAALLVVALVAGAAAAPPAAAQDTHLLVVTGIAGSEEHGARFHDWASRIVDATKDAGLADASITYLGDRPDRDPARIADRSTRENVTKALEGLAARAGRDDEVFVVLIGHGTFDGRQGSFNLPGPDLSAAEYATLLDRFSSQQVVFVNTASSSGAFLPVLAGPGRTIVTATKTGGERNETRFPEFFVEALEGAAADQDRDGRVSILEAFEFARRRVETSYEASGHIPTEHPTLDDSADGKMASMLYMAPRRSRAAGMADASPELVSLLEDQEALERQIAAFRLRKDAMNQESYERELERLLTELALKSRAVRALREQP